MHEKVLPRGSKNLLDKLARIAPALLKDWILAGGTGLALHLGHRVSEDFDFFRTDAFDVRAFHRLFRSAGTYETLQEADHTLTVLIKGVKLSLFRVANPFLFKPEPYRSFSVADIRDIALMKLIAVSGRGSRKDFVDLYSILRAEPGLPEYFDWLPKKYGAGRVNSYHILKSLTYFEDAEKEPMPRMLTPFNWKECKAFFVREAHAVVLPPHRR
jgi:hypothetical protein